MTPPDPRESGDITLIDVDDFIDAANDPKVHAMWAEADALAERLIASGHCRCHLVINCPNTPASRY